MNTQLKNEQIKFNLRETKYIKIILHMCNKSKCNENDDENDKVGAIFFLPHI